MDQWFRHISKFGTSAIILICLIMFGLLACALFYLMWNFGSNSIIGIPLHLVLVTIIFPVVLAGAMFWLARKLELAARRSENE